MAAPGETDIPSDAWIELSDRTLVPLTKDCRIGRFAGNEIVNPDPKISRQNSVVTRQGEHFVLVDLGSTNGTFLNGNRIYKPARLTDGDVIQIGSERYTFREPASAARAAARAEDSEAFRTQVSVGMTQCWMLGLVALGATQPPVAAWLEAMRQALVDGGAGVKRMPGAALFAHWRDGRDVTAKARAFVGEFARHPRPPGARLAIHHGSVRVGPSANPAEENLLGADVAFTHQLVLAAAKLDAEILLSEEAKRLLELVPPSRPLGPQTVGSLPGTYPLFSVPIP